MAMKYLVLVFLTVAAILGAVCVSRADTEATPAPVKDIQKSYTGKDADSQKSTQDKSWEGTVQAEQKSASEDKASSLKKSTADKSLKGASRVGHIPAFQMIPQGLTKTEKGVLEVEKMNLQSGIQRLKVEAAKFNALPAEDQTDRQLNDLQTQKDLIIMKVNHFNMRVKFIKSRNESVMAAAKEVPDLQPVPRGLTETEKAGFVGELKSLKAELSSYKEDAAKFMALPAEKQTEQQRLALSARKDSIIMKVDAFNAKWAGRK
jgi:hypothetical protein